MSIKTHETKNYREYVKPNLKKIEKWYSEGLTDFEVAERLGIGRSTIYAYKNTSQEFSDTIRRGKQNANFKVEDALYKRCTGYEYEEKEYRTIVDKDGNEREVLAKRTIKQVAPDVKAQELWLTNRDRENWSHRHVLNLTGKDDEKLEVSFITKEVDNESINT